MLSLSVSASLMLSLLTSALLSCSLTLFLALYFPCRSPSVSYSLPSSLSDGLGGRGGGSQRGDQWGLSLSGEHGWICTPSPSLDVVPTLPLGLMGRRQTVLAQVDISQMLLTGKIIPLVIRS